MKQNTSAIKHLKKIQEVEKRKHHPLIHHIHKKFGISRKTLFYVKEYGPKSNVVRTIVVESFAILIFASILSSLGGFALEKIKYVFAVIIPFVIMLPMLNDMIGDYGTIISSRLSTMLHEGKISKNWWADKKLFELYAQILIVSVIIALFSAFMAMGISNFSDYYVGPITALKIIAITLIDTVLLVSLLSLIAIVAGIHYFKKGEDPNNLLIPITTSIADMSNMIILALLVILFF